MIGVTDVDVGQILLDTGGACSNLFLLDILAELKTALRVLDAVKVGLFTGAIAPGPGLLLATVLAAAPADAGYALSSVVVWGADHILGGNICAIVGDTKEFSCTTTPGDVVTGWFLQSAAGLGPKLVKAARFKTPFTFDQIGATLPVIPTFAISGAV